MRRTPPGNAEGFFRIIEEQAERMEGLIGDLLDAGRFEAGMLTVAPERAEVAVHAASVSGKRTCTSAWEGMTVAGRAGPPRRMGLAPRAARARHFAPAVQPCTCV